MSKEIELLKELETRIRNTTAEGFFKTIEPYEDSSSSEEFRIESCYIGGLESILEELDEIRQQKVPMENR